MSDEGTNIERGIKLNKTLVWTDGLSPWYHCKVCLDNGVSVVLCRIAVNNNFCHHCGGKIDWEAPVWSIL